jgi:hypothetical protein
VKLGGFRGVKFTAKHIQLAVAARREKAWPVVTQNRPPVALADWVCRARLLKNAGLQPRPFESASVAVA